MLEEFLRKLKQPKRKPLTEAERHAISTKLHKEIGTALNNAAKAGMPIEVETKYTLGIVLPLVQAIAEGKGQAGALLTIVNADTGEKIVDGTDWTERTVH